MIEETIHRMRYGMETFLDQRRVMDGFLGLPALSALVLCVLMFAQLRSDPGSGLLETLEKEAQKQLDTGHYVEARILARRLSQADTLGQKASVIEAKALRGMGKEREAARLLARVAPLDMPGHAPAHVMQAALLLAQQPPDAQTALRHIDNALHSDPSNQDALEIAARFAAARRDWKTTLARLDNLNLNARPDLLLMKATALQFSGLEDESIQCAGLAEVSLRAMQNTLTEGTDRVRLSIAASLSLQRKYRQAIDWLLETTPTQPSKEERQVLGGIYLSWSRHLKSKPGASMLEVLELVEKAIEISPESQDIIMTFLADCEEINASADQRRRLVERVLFREGIAQSFLHYYLGLQEWKQDRRQAALSHFELASTINPRFGIVTNNLAMAIASVSTEKRELERALSMMDQLLKQQPQNPFFLDTRGHVLIKLGRLNEAARDLARALPDAPNKASANTTLAAVYQKLGMAELAAQHQSLAAQMTTPNKR